MYVENRGHWYGDKSDADIAKELIHIKCMYANIVYTGDQGMFSGITVAESLLVGITGQKG